MAKDALAEREIRVSEKLFQDRSTTENHWQLIRDYIRPLSQSFNSTNTPGERSRHLILDNSTESVSEILSATIYGEITNPADKWFELQSDDKRLNRDREVAGWLEDTESRLYRILDNPRTRWNANLPNWYGELVDFGTGVMAQFSEFGVGVRFKHYPLSGIALIQNADGIVDGLHFKFKLSAAAASAKWNGKAGEAVEKAAADPQKALDEFEFLRVVKPMDRADNAGRRWHSWYFSIKDRATIEDKAFFEFPFMVARLSRRDNEVYGRGRGMVALDDVRMLQRGMRATIRAVEKMIDPALMVPDDGIIGPLTLQSGEVNVFRADFLGARQAPIKAVESGGNPQVGDEFMDKIRARVDAAYYGHLLRIPREPRMLQDQILDIAEERARVMGPVFGGVQEEGPGPAVERLLAIGLRSPGALLPPPAALIGKQVGPKFQNPFAQARAVTDARSINRWVNMLLPWADRDPTILDIVDFDESGRLAGAGLNAPLTAIRDPKVVAAIREARAEREQRAEEAAIAKDQGAAAQSSAQAVASLRPAA